MRAPVFVHGATGFTGRLVCAALRERGVPFAIGGRSAARLDALAAELGGVERQVVDITDAGSIRAALDGRTIVCACAGPFGAIGEPVLASSARAGVHYVDTTGEQGFVALAASRYRATAEASGACIVPAMAFEIAPGDWAAHAAAELLGGGVDAVDVAYVSFGASGAGATTRGTKLSALSVIGDGDAKQYVAGALVREPAGEVVRTFTTARGETVHAVSFPSPEAVVVPAHTRAKTVRAFMAAGRGSASAFHVARGVAPAIARVARPIVERLVAWTPEGPVGDARTGQFEVVAEARKGERTARVSVTGRDPYGLTGAIQAIAAQRAVAGKITARGVLAPSQIIAPRDACAELAAFELTIHPHVA